jgi:hypothetical protein
MLISAADKDFEAFIRNMVGPEQYDKLKEGDKKYMMGMFELGVKPSFQYDNRENGRLIVDLRGVQDDSKKGIVNDTIKLKQYVSFDRLPCHLLERRLTDIQASRGAQGTL